MIVRDDRTGLGDPYFYAACLACGWCSLPCGDEREAGSADDNHLAAKLAARADRREAPTSLTPAAAGSVGTSEGAA